MKFWVSSAICLATSLQGWSEGRQTFTFLVDVQPSLQLVQDFYSFVRSPYVERGWRTIVDAAPMILSTVSMDTVAERWIVVKYLKSVLLPPASGHELKEGGQGIPQTVDVRWLMNWEEYHQIQSGQHVNLVPSIVVDCPLEIPLTNGVLRMRKQIEFFIVEEKGRLAIDGIRVNGLWMIGGPSFDEWMLKSPCTWPDLTIGLQQRVIDLHNESRPGAAWVGENEEPHLRFSDNSWTARVEAGIKLYLTLVQHALFVPESEEFPDIFEFESVEDSIQRRQRSKQVWLYLKGQSWLIRLPTRGTDTSCLRDQVVLWLKNPSRVALPANFSAAQNALDPVYLIYSYRTEGGLTRDGDVSRTPFDRTIWVPVVPAKDGPGFRILYDKWTVNGLYVRELERGIALPPEVLYRVLGFPTNEKRILQARDELRGMWSEVGQ